MRNTLFRILQFIHPGGHKHANYVKVLLPGERPWVEVLDERDGKIRGKITNKLYAEYSEHEQAQFMKREWGSIEPLPKLHDFKKGDELWFEQGAGNCEGWLVPMKEVP